MILVPEKEILEFWIPYVPMTITPPAQWNSPVDNLGGTSDRYKIFQNEHVTHNDWYDGLLTGVWHIEWSVVWEDGPVVPAQEMSFTVLPQIARHPPGEPGGEHYWDGTRYVVNPPTSTPIFRATTLVHGTPLMTCHGPLPAAYVAGVDEVMRSIGTMNLTPILLHLQMDRVG